MRDGGHGDSLPRHLDHVKPLDAINLPRYGCVMTIDHALDSIGVGRPLGDGRRWTRASFCSATGVPPAYLGASRAGTERQERIARAVQWCALILGGEMPPDWQRDPATRKMAVRVLRAWCAANGIGEDTSWLRGWLVRWGVERVEVGDDELTEALARESWAGVLGLVRR